MVGGPRAFAGWFLSADGELADGKSSAAAPHSPVNEKAMLQRLLSAGIVCALFGAPAAADTLDAQLFPLTGEVRFHNPNGAAVPFVYYSITSMTAQSGCTQSDEPTLAVDLRCLTIASGNGFIDPTNDCGRSFLATSAPS